MKVVTTIRFHTSQSFKVKHTANLINLTSCKHSSFPRFCNITCIAQSEAKPDRFYLFYYFR